MRLRKPLLPILFLGLIGILAPVGVKGQTIVASARSLQDLTDDLEYLIGAMTSQGDPQVAQLRAVLGQFRNGDAIKGLDISRRFGIAVTLPRDFPAGDPPTIVAAVPVSDLGALLGSIQGFGFAVDNQPGIPGFSHKVTAPNGQTNLFVLSSKGYALFSMVPAGAEKLRSMDPSAWSPKDRSETLMASIRLSELPPAIQEQFLGSFRQSMMKKEDREPGESEATYQGRIAGQKAFASMLETMVRQGDSLEMNLDVDSKAGRIVAQLSISAKPGTEMAQTLRSIRGRRSRFANLDAGGPLAIWANLPMVGIIRQGLTLATEQGERAQRAKGFSGEAEKKLFDRFTELIRSNLKADDLDAGVAFRPSKGDPSHYTGLTGVQIRDGKAFDRLLRDLDAQSKPESKGNVEHTLDIDRMGDGTPIHQLSGPFKEKDRDVVRMLGKKATLRFAFRKDALVAAFGEDSASAIREALDRVPAAARDAKAASPPVGMIVRMSQFDVFPSDERDRQAHRRAADHVFRGEAAKKDRAELTVSSHGDEIRVHLGVDVPALRYLAEIGKATRH